MGTHLLKKNTTAKDFSIKGGNIIEADYKYFKEDITLNGDEKLVSSQREEHTDEVLNMKSSDYGRYLIIRKIQLVAVIIFISCVLFSIYKLIS